MDLIGKKQKFLHGSNIKNWGWKVPSEQGHLFFISSSFLLHSDPNALVANGSWVTCHPLCCTAIVDVEEMICAIFSPKPVVIDYYGPWPEELGWHFNSLDVPNANVTLFNKVWLKLWYNVSNCSFPQVGRTFLKEGS
jgi:hypothetical protein